MQSSATGTFLSTPSARRATVCLQRGRAERGISIHALREEGDKVLFLAALTVMSFLSTPSARRATRTPVPSSGRHPYFYPRPPRGGRRPPPGCTCSFSYFYPRPPRGGRRSSLPVYRRRKNISIHALREEGDVSCVSFITSMYPFLSTPSARRATSPPPGCTCSFSYFYPRPPRGGRPP